MVDRQLTAGTLDERGTLFGRDLKLGCQPRGDLAGRAALVVLDLLNRDRGSADAPRQRLLRQVARAPLALEA